MIELASHILDTKAAHFDPAEIQGRVRECAEGLVKRKAAGKPIKAAEREEKPDNVISLMDALKQSLKGKRHRPSARPSAIAAPGRVSRRRKKAHRSAARARKAG